MRRGTMGMGSRALAFLGFFFSEDAKRSILIDGGLPRVCRVEDVLIVRVESTDCHTTRFVEGDGVCDGGGHVSLGRELEKVANFRVVVNRAEHQRLATYNARRTRSP